MRQRNYKNLHQITAFSAVFPINVYVWEEPTELTIIDIGLKSFVKPIAELSEKLNKPVKTLILTHPHFDHINGLDHFKEKFPEAKVVFSARDAKLLQGDLTLETGESSDEIKGGFTKVLTRPDVLVSDGSRIGSLQVIATPGHTPGSISLYHPETKILIVGDAMQTQGGFAIAGDKRFLFPFPAQGTWSKETALVSARKLAELEVDCLATGHGKLLFQPDFNSVIQRLESKINHEKEN